MNSYPLDCDQSIIHSSHAVLHDYNTGAQYTPLQNLPGAKSKFHVINSPLSEYGALGFEVGYSLESPNALVIWEAQYGKLFDAHTLNIEH